MTKNVLMYIKTFLKWILLSLIVGAAGGIVGSIFHKAVDYVTELRTAHIWIIFLLPFGGLAIAGMYRAFKSKGNIDTNRVIDSVSGKEKVPLIMLPLIFVSTVITHLLGGSAGREGAALQLGGSIGYNLGKAMHLKKGDIHIIVMAGMSAVFAALFGTPLAAAFFALEVSMVGVMHYAALLPCVASAIAAYVISLGFGVVPVRFDIALPDTLSVPVVLQTILLATLCALVAIGFCSAIKHLEKMAKKWVPNIYLRTIAGSAVIVIATMLIGTDYNGAGMNIISNAFSGIAKPEAFVLKIAFTAVTLAAGFKGGEIVPAFFVGSTFGCAFAPLIGLNPVIGAAIGFVALFCGVVNCPVASLLLGIEVFGGQGILLFGITCAISYMMSGNFGLYKSQKIVYSKLNANYIDEE